MMNFQEQVIADLGVFVNSTEFAEAHEVGGVLVDCVVDTDAREAWRGRYPQGQQRFDGVRAAWRVVYVREDAFAAVPMIGQVTTLDGQAVVVTDVQREAGLLVLSLERAEAPAGGTTCTVQHFGADDGWFGPQPTGTEAGIACRFTLAAALVAGIGGPQVAAEAQVVFGPGSGLACLAIGDRICAITGVSGTWAVVRVAEERDGAGQVVTRTAFCVAAPA